MLLIFALFVLARADMYTLVTTEHGNEYPWESASIRKVLSDGSQVPVWPVEVHGSTDWMWVLGGDPKKNVMLVATDMKGIHLFEKDGLTWKDSSVSQSEVSLLRYLGNDVFSAVCMASCPSGGYNGVIFVNSSDFSQQAGPPGPSGPGQPQLLDYVITNGNLMTTIVDFETEVIPGYSSNIRFVQWNLERTEVISNVTLDANRWNNKTWATNVYYLAPTQNASSPIFFCFAEQQNVTNLPYSGAGEPIYYSCTVDISTGELTLLEQWPVETLGVGAIHQDPLSSNWIVFGNEVFWLDPVSFKVVKTLKTSASTGMAFMEG
jgi:hypothetical protein